MHYTCQLALRLCSVCECFVFSMFTCLCVHFSMCVLVITSNRRLCFWIYSQDFWFSVFLRLLYMHCRHNFIGPLDIVQSEQVYHFCCLKSYQQHCGQLIWFPSPQSLLQFSFMSLSPFQLISREKIFLPYFPSLQQSLSNFLHLYHPFAFTHSCNLPRLHTPPFIAHSASKCRFVFCLVALTHIILGSPSEVCLTVQSTNLLLFRD